MTATAADRPALEGGTPVRTRPFPDWPPPATAEQRRLLLQVLENGRWGASAGPLASEFAARFARMVGVSHGVAVANGTLALFAALRGLGVRPGDEVVVPAYTFIASATAVLLAGARPVFADVTADTLHVDAAAVAAAVTPRTVAVMPVHLAGAPADMDAIGAVAARHGLAVVEDAAQAHGAAWRDRRVGGLGDAGCFSFQSSKAMTAGEGGMVVTDREDVHREVWAAVNVGRTPGGGWYEHHEVGWNLRLTEFQSAVLLPQLDLLSDQISRREKAAAHLARGLASQGEGVQVIGAPEGTARHAHHLLLLRYRPEFFAGRPKEWFIAALEAEGIPCDAGYRPLHRVPALIAALGATPPSCPVAEEAWRNVLWLRQPLLMADLADLDDVLGAVAKLRRAARTERLP